MTEESIVAVLRGLKGKTVDIVYDLFFTDRRVVAAIVLAPSDFLDMYEKRDIIDIAIGNWAKQKARKIRSLDLIDERRVAFENKSAEEILAMHKGSMSIDYEDIVSVQVKKGFIGTRLEFTVRGPMSKVEFSIEEKQIAEIQQVLAKVLSSKLR